MLWLLNAMSAKLMIAEFQVQVENPVCNYALRQIAKRDEILHVVSYPNIYLYFKSSINFIEHQRLDAVTIVPLVTIGLRFL